MNMRLHPILMAVAMFLAASLAAEESDNPVWTGDTADPTCWSDGRGGYLLTSTSRKVLASADLIHWRVVRDGFLTDAETARLKTIAKGIWAPDVFRLAEKRWNLYVSLWNGPDDTQIWSYTCDVPEGPFTNGVCLITSRDTKIADSIDPEVVRDPDSGRLWLFFGSTGGIYRVPLAEDGRALATNATYTAVAGIKGDPAKGPVGRERVFEAAYLYRRGDWWYLFASRGWFNDASYGIVVGRARKLTDDFTDRAGRSMREGFAEVFLTSDEKDELFGPGHNGEIVTDADGRTFITYHCHDRKGDMPTKKDAYISRPLCLQEVFWSPDGWPFVKDGKPQRHIPVAPVATNDWENPAVNSLNRLPARTYSMPLKSVQAAFTEGLEPETPYCKSLNGDWKFAWAGSPDLRIKDFWKPDFDDADWQTIDVPSCVEMRGYGTPGYTNQRYPHANTVNPTKPDFARILDFERNTADYNPVSSYRTRFTIPAGWKGREVILRFDGVYSAYYVWVNGRKVGYAEDSKLPSEFNITPYLKEAENLLAVEVYRWCDGSFLEDQDMFRYSGIFRDVSIWAKPKDGIWDFTVRTRPLDEGYKSWSLELELEKGCSASLYDADYKKVGDLKPLSNSNCQLQLNPRVWSAEDPYLYTLVIRKGDDIRMKRVGFKDQRREGSTVLVNGKAIKFKGVNRHEHSAENGRTVSLDEMLQDVLLMKRYNIDTVRTSHYPDHHLWYDLCDRYGIYLVAEANVEGHGAQFGEDGIGKHRVWDASIVERNERHCVTYRNHPSIVFFSMGNETCHGDGFRQAIAAVHRLDPTRPTIWECGNRDADVDARMYPELAWLRQRGEYGEGKCDTMPPRYKGDEADQTKGKPFFLVEYAHAMGNALGNFQEYWDVFYSSPALLGGCIWDWVDQALWKYEDRIDPATGRRMRYLAYGGDWDEWPNDGAFCCNGVIRPDRSVSAKLVEVAHVHRNLVVTRKADGSFDLWNRFGFTRADAYEGCWEVLQDGVIVCRGTFAVPPVEPLSHGALDLSAALAETKDLKGEVLLNVLFQTKADTRWAKAGWIVARNQLALPEQTWDFAAVGASAVKAAELKTVSDAQRLVVEAGGTRAVFCRKTGLLAELTMAGRTIFKDPDRGIPSGPHLTLARAWTDNDGWLNYGWKWFEPCQTGGLSTLGLTHLFYHAAKLRVSGSTVSVVTDVTGAKNGGYRHEATYEFKADGSIVMANKVTSFGTVPGALPRLGLAFKLHGDLENLSWYGRGPFENYADRKTGSLLGRWSSTVTEQFEPYVRPQDNGYKCDVRSVRLTDGAGRGIEFAASRPLYLQALHFNWEDLEFARQHNGMMRHATPLVPQSEVCLNLDVAQTGLGGLSCGPMTIPAYRYSFPAEGEEWTLRLTPVLRNGVER